VGIVGGGPAGLACAHRLRRFGHRVTIYEKRPSLGGLNATGVAPYKMRADRAQEEVDRVLAIGGIEVRTGVEIPRDVSWGDLLQRHQALFLGFGLGPDTVLDLPGGDAQGVIGAVDWIERMKLGRVDLAGVERAVVLGGGNTAVDVVRELLGLGVREVRLAYRGAEAQMSGYEHEWAAAKHDGAVASWQVAPVGYEVRDGRVVGVKAVRCDAGKKPIPGSDHVIPAELVVVAVGQSKLAHLAQGLELEVAHGRIVTDASGATSRPGVYAGGDGGNGGKEVVNAVAEGRDAAVAMNGWLMGRK
jgi:glutamate synthase (NADPH/NADH) small chain